MKEKIIRLHVRNFTSLSNVYDAVKINNILSHYVEINNKYMY